MFPYKNYDTAHSVLLLLPFFHLPDVIISLTVKLLKTFSAVMFHETLSLGSTAVILPALGNRSMNMEHREKDNSQG